MVANRRLQNERRLGDTVNMGLGPYAAKKKIGATY
jgi:hypothetical protein